MHLLLLKRQAVGALIHRGVAFVRADADVVERAVILRAAVMVAGNNAAFDRLVGFAIRIHVEILLFELQSYCAQLSKPHS